MQLKPGLKLNGTTSTAQVIVIRGTGEVDIRCAGAIMSTDVAAETPAEGESDRTVQLGKRYTDVAGTVDLLCTKPGVGPLSIGEVELQLKATKALPASD